MVGWHHQLNGHEFEQAPGVGDGQGSLVCCSPWDRKELDTTERLNWTEQWWFKDVGLGLELSFCSDDHASTPFPKTLLLLIFYFAKLSGNKRIWNSPSSNDDNFNCISEEGIIISQKWGEDQWRQCCTDGETEAQRWSDLPQISHIVDSQSGIWTLIYMTLQPGL